MKSITRKIKTTSFLLGLFLISLVSNAQTGDVRFMMAPSDKGTLTVESNPMAHNTTVSYAVGQTISISAVCTVDNYEFNQWTITGGASALDANSPSTTVTIPEGTGTINIVARFVQSVTRYTVTASVVPENAGYISPATQLVNEGGSTQIVVHPSDEQHYEFSGWSLSDDPAQTKLQPIPSSTYVVENVQENKTFYAHYTYQNQLLTVTAAASEGGSATVSYGGNVDQTSISNIPENNEFTLTATANSNYAFTGWTREGSSRIISTENPWLHSMPAFSSDSTYTAHFSSTISYYDITVLQDVDGGLVASTNGFSSILSGTSVTLSVSQLYSGFSFDGFYIDYNNDGQYSDDELVSDPIQQTFTFNIRENMTVYAKFHHNPYPLTVVSNPVGAGVFTITGDVIEENNNYSVTAGGAVNVSVAVAQGQEQNYRFNNWTGAVSSSETSVSKSNVNSNLTFTANFVNTYTLTLGDNITLTPGTGVVQNANGTYDAGSTFTAAANAVSGMEFNYWVVDGVDHPELTNPSYAITLDHNMHLEAAYIATRTVTVNSNPGAISNLVLTINGNTATPGTAYTFREGTQVTVAVNTTSVTTHTYVKWVYDGSDVQVNEDGENFYSFTLGNDNVSLYAVFQPVAQTYTVTTHVNNDAYGNITSDRVNLVNGIATGVQSGIVLDLQANANAGYRFDHWDVDGVVYNNNPLNQGAAVQVNRNMDITAYFVPSTAVNINVATYPENDPNITITITDLDNNPVSDISTGDNIVIRTFAPSNTNYTFWLWLVDGVPAGEPGVPTLTLRNVTQNMNVVAWYYVPSTSNDAEILEFNTDSTEVLYVKPQYRSLVTAITIPFTTQGVQAIHENAFANCSNLQHINLAPTVETIGKYAFSNCVSLEELVVPNSDATIDSNAFYGCTSLRRVVLPANLQVIKSGLFSGCTALTDANIPATVTEIESEAFMGCRSIMRVDLPASLRIVGDQAFMGMRGLRFVNIEAGVTTFGEDCFENCVYIAQTNFNGSVADWCNITFANPAANPIAKSHNLFLNDVVVTTLDIPGGVTEINKYAFYYNTHIDTIVLPAMGATIADSAFYRLTNLQRIILTGDPAAIVVAEEAFNTVDKNNVVVEVPCTHYTAGMTWNGFTNVVATGKPVVTVLQRPGGVVAITHAPNCDDEDYYYTLTATPANNFEFTGWSDGVSGESRTIRPTADMVLVPIWEHASDALNVEEMGKITFEPNRNNPNPAASWFMMNNGANAWMVGDALNHTTPRGSNALYVSNDGAHATYSLGSSPYTYTEVLINDAGLYELKFHAKVSNVDGHYLTAALFPVPSNIEDDDFDRLNPYSGTAKFVIDSINGPVDNNDDPIWKVKLRLFNVNDNELGWYRLAFFWNVTNEDPVANFSAAIDDIEFNFLDEDELSQRIVTVDTRSNDDNFGYTHTGEVAPNETVSAGDATTHKVYFFDDVIQIHAYPAAGYRLANWDDNGSTEAHRTLDFVELFNVGANIFTANFEPIPEHLTFAVRIEDGANGKGTPAIKYTYDNVEIAGQFRTVNEFVADTTIDENTQNQTFVLVLNEPQAEWAFMGWANENGDTLSTENPFALSYGEMPNKIDWSNNVTIFALMNQLPECPNSDFDFSNPSFYGRYDFRGRDIDDNDVVSNVEISTRNGQIIVSEANGVEVSLYDVNGRLLETKVDNAQTIYFEVPVTGTYMLKVGNLMIKKIVVVR